MKNIKKFISVLVLLILCFIVSGSVNAEDLYETVDPSSAYSFSTALELEEGKIYYRNYSSNLHSRKWYSTFVVDENSYAMIGFSSKYYYDVSIYDENYNLILDLGSKKDYSGYFPFKKGKYYIMLNNDAFSTNSVSLSYDLQRNVSCEIEPNDTFSEATEIKFDKNYLIFIGEPGNKDYLSFNTEGYKTIRVTVDGYENAKIFMRLYESDRATYKILTLKYDDKDNVYYYEFEPKYSGNYFIETYSFSDEICYSVAINGVHEHTYITTITKMATCITTGMKTYTCSCGDTKVETIPANGHKNQTMEGYAATCVEDGLTDGTYCSVCYETIVEQTTIPKKGHTKVESLKKATLSANGSYKNYCKVCDKVFEKRTIERPTSFKFSSTTVTYNGKVRKPTATVKTSSGKELTAGKDYDIKYPSGGCKLPGKYTISLVFKGDYSSTKKLTFTIKPKATTGVKAKTITSSAITLEWTKTTGATGYKVCMYDSSKGEYVVKKSLTGTSYKVTSLKAGTTYKFKIRAYTKSGDTVISAADSSVLTTATKPATPTIKSVSNSSRKVTITWNNVSGESGYQIYYATSKNGTYKKLATVSANKVKYTSDNLTAGKTYYFKVRAYKKVNDETIYSGFSEVKSVKIAVVYYVTKTGKKYHVDGCRSLSKSKIKISYNDAVSKGYKPCNSCIK